MQSKYINFPKNVIYQKHQVRHISIDWEELPFLKLPNQDSFTEE